MRKSLTVIGVLLLLCLTVESQIVHSLRGPARDGIYNEKDLLKEWPAEGPAILWVYEELGKGFTSPVLVNNKIYVTGMEGKIGHVYIFSEQGKFEKKYPYGAEISASAGYPGTRSTPTIVDNLMYVATGHGELICLNLDDGKKVWTKDLFSDFDGKNIRWSLTENLIIDGDMLFVAPGGKENNIVALNRNDGSLIWSSPGHSDVSAYCSPLLIAHNGKKILVTIMAKHVLGIDTENGKLLWSYPYANFRNIHPNAPIFHDNNLYVFSGYGYGGKRLKIEPDGKSLSKVWFNETVDPKMGGAVLINGFIYASGDKNRRWFCVNWETGEITYESKDIDKGTIIAADGLMYAYTERGELALLEPLDGSFRIVSQTEVKHGDEQHWAHPVIHNGILYIRHGNALIAYDIRKN